MKNSTPFRVDFFLASPIQMDHLPVHLDGLISWALLQEKTANAEPTNPFDLKDSIYTDIPLGQEHGIYQASVLQVGNVSHVGNRFFSKKNPAEELGAYRADFLDGKHSPVKGLKNLGVLNSTSGEFKNSLIFAQPRVCEKVFAYGIGDMKTIETLLKEHVFSIGKNRNKGFGRVWKIECVEDENAIEGWKKRAYLDNAKGRIPIHGRARAPYWNKEAASTVYVDRSVF